MIDGLKKLGKVSKCPGYRAETPHVLGMIPSRIMTAAVCVRDECDPRVTARGRYLTGLRLRRDNRRVDPSLIPDSARPSDSFSIS